MLRRSGGGLDVQFPDGFIFASYQPFPRWSVYGKMAKLAKPFISHGEEITEQVSQMSGPRTALSARTRIP